MAATVERRAKHRSDDPASAARLALALDGEERARKEKKEKRDKKDKKPKDHHRSSPSRSSPAPDAAPAASPPAASAVPARMIIPSSASAPLGGALRPNNANVVRTPAPGRAPAEELLDHVLGVAPSESAAALSEYVCAYRYFLQPRELLLQLITRFKNAPAVGRYAPEEVQRDWKARSGEAVRGRVVSLLEAWVREHFYDFEDDDVLFRSLLAFLDSTHASLPAPVARVRLAVQDESAEPLLRLFGAHVTADHVASALRKPSAAPLFAATAPGGGAAVSGADLAEWLLANTALTSRAEAAHLAVQMLRAGVLAPVAAAAGRGPAPSEFHADSTLYVLSPPLDAAPPPVPASPAKLDSFLALSVEEVARQVTLVAHEVFARVRPADLKAPLTPLALSLSDGGQGSALQTLQALHERTAYWVASEVVLSKAAAERAAMLGRFVALAEALRALRNYHGLFAVMAGLALKPVERLRASWRALDADRAAAYEALSELVSPASAFAAYRAELAQAPLPAFPQLALVVADVRALESSASDFSDERHRDVNYKKLRSFAAMYAQQIRPYQRRAFAFAAVPAVQEYLARAVVIAHPADLYKISLQCEPLA